MIKSFKYVECTQSKLHEFIINFFSRIEYETGEFDDSFFEVEFLPIANKHPRIIKKRCKDIFETIKTWNQANRSLICKQIKESNEIEKICKGIITPLDENLLPPTIKENLKSLFISLYESVLKKSEEYINKYGSLKEHFEKFKTSPNNLTLCIACGLNHAKTKDEPIRDQYDHYLPKDIYPLSSVNFKNLVPICSECNSILTKGAKDVLKETSGKLFFPFDDNHKGIDVIFSIIKDDVNIEKIEWHIDYLNSESKVDEINSWKYIFNIDERYKGFVKGRIESWYRHYWEMMNDNDMQHISESDKKLFYFKFMAKEEQLLINFIHRPALEGFLKNTHLAQAQLQMKHYS